MASTRVIDLKNPAANTNARVSYPLLTEHVQGPRQYLCAGIDVSILFVLAENVSAFGEPACES